MQSNENKDTLNVESNIANSKFAPKMINWFCLSGVLSLIFYFLHDEIGRMYYPGYNWMSQAVSDLTAVNAPSRMIAGGLSNVYGLFAVTCCTIICIYFQGKGSKVLRVGIYMFALMNWISGIGYSIFPLSKGGYAGTFQDIMHLYIVTGLVVILSIVSLILIIIGGFRNNRKYYSLSILAIIALLSMFIGAIGTNLVPNTYFGLIERFSTYSAVVFTAILGLYGFAFFDLIENLRYRV